LILLTLDAKTILRKIEKPSVSPPKRPITAYLIFAGSRMASAIESESDVDARKRMVQAARKVATEWKTMSDQEKKVIHFTYNSHFLSSMSLPNVTMKASCKSIYQPVLPLMHF
jgi:hypothetical protein